ncbi:hypothetical protein B0H14DRAFT_3476586 [Mycena olivaceomarginata]|nr:hypothetical protein B0H14DRAFT_3476586 [Mycena olivaceomarginata]
MEVVAAGDPEAPTPASIAPGNAAVASSTAHMDAGEAGGEAGGAGMIVDMPSAPLVTNPAKATGTVAAAAAETRMRAALAFEGLSAEEIYEMMDDIDAAEEEEGMDIDEN